MDTYNRRCLKTTPITFNCRFDRVNDYDLLKKSFSFSSYSRLNFEKEIFFSVNKFANN